MKIGVICPHRNDRPEFLAQFKKYLAAQTLQPDDIIFVNHEPESNEIDITHRYRIGYENIQKLVDVVLFMEVDDFYHPEYIKTIVNAWKDEGRPEAFSLGNSIYYHISGKWFNINRPSANTFLLRSGLRIDWRKDNYPYVDVTLLGKLFFSFKTINPPICIGIKHGIGLVGGGCHNSDNERYVNDDSSGEWLRSVVGDENFEFYRHMQIQKGIKQC